MKNHLLSLLVFLSLLGGCLPKKDQDRAAETPPPSREPSSMAAPAEAPNQIPTDPKVTIGKLQNGLTYYLRKNVKPENRAELRLVIKAGSLQEDEDQRGLAHFVEHMAFNGTKHFEKQDMVDYTQSIGMRFGADINAYTSFDETVYQLQIPTDDPEIIEKAFLILEDWAHGISFDTEEIEKERGVIVEEWRLRRGAQSRIQDKQIPVLYHKSRYVDRLPIGQKEIIENAPREALTRFYADWYRPDLMAVVAVGDFEISKITELIKNHFGHIPAVENPRPTETYSVPDHEQTLFSIETDPELTRSNIQVGYKHPAKTVKTFDDYRASFVISLYEYMLNQRLHERSKEADPPFVYGYSSMSSLVPEKDVFIQAAMIQENDFQKGLAALLIEAERAKRFGFTQTELERQKKELLRSYERAHQERDKSSSAGYAGLYSAHFTNQTPIPGIERIMAFVTEILPTITLDEVNRVADDWITENNRVILISAPEKEGLTVPTRETVLETIEKVAGMDITPYEDDISDAPLVRNLPEPGSITSEHQVPELGLWDWQLANGVRVILKPTDFKNDEIQFTSFSPGGTSKAADEDYVASFTATSLINESGLGEFNALQLEKLLAGKVVNVSPYIGELSEGIGGLGSMRDLEELFQVIYLYFTAPRADPEAFQSTVSKWRTFVKNRDASPGRVFSDQINKTLYQDHPRRKPFTMETLEKANLEKSLRFFKDRFSDAGDFTFIFVGNFEVETLKPLVLRYLGGLPANGREESWRDIGADRIEGQHEVVVRKGLEPKSSVRILFTGDAEWNMDTRYAMRSLTEVLRIRLREILREDMGGVYGVGVSGSVAKRPKERFSATVSFGCDPANVEALTKAVIDEIDQIKQNGIEQSYLDKVREAQLRSYETAQKRNSFWMANLNYYYDYGLDPLKILEFEKRTERLTSDLIRQAARSYFDEANRLTAVLYPEEATN